jgi:hypothetical protein
MKEEIIKMSENNTQNKLLSLEAGILNHSSRQSMEETSVLPSSRKLDDYPNKHIEHENLIINTLIHAKAEGKAENTVHSIDKSLRQLSRKINLTQPQQVKDYIANALNQETGEPLSNATKNKLCFAYDWLCKANQMEWTKEWHRPFYKVEEGTPLIPTTENITKIISASSKRFATIFTILAETGAEGEELHKTHRNKIDAEQGIVSITETKGHGSANYKLKAQTAEMLRQYLKENPQEHPFPKAKIMAQMWQRTRDRLANNLNQPELKYIPLKNLRNYSGAKMYYATLDPIAVMRHFRHKKLETTMHYIRGIILNGEEEYTCKTATTVQEATTLIEQGFQYVTEMDGIKLFRKRK